MNGLLPSQLRSLSYLTQEKEQELKEIVGNLKPNDLDDSHFDHTLERIKGQVLLNPVTFDDPKIRDHRTEDRQMQGNAINPFPHRKQITIVDVEFPFEGSEELFSHSPNGYSFGGSGTRVYQPDYGNSITIEVEVDNLDKDLVLSRARQQMDTTFSLIKQINPSVESWSRTKESQIESMLKNKKDELDNFYK